MNQEDKLFQGQEMNVLLLIVSNGILTMVIKNGKKRL
jgi:hypothetical protein